MKTKPFPRSSDGQWIRTKSPRHLLQCCDCGLVHLLEFRTIDGLVQFRAWRKPRMTSDVRKKLGIIIREATDD